jgi:6-phosphogluconolactonase
MNIDNKLNRIVRIFRTPEELAETFALELVNRIREAEVKRSSFTIALSGGSTPALLYSILAEKHGNAIDWSFVHLFWGDERCVGPGDPESNFGMTDKKLISKINIPASNIHRVKGEADPVKEAVRYSEEIVRYTRTEKNIPVFDQIILGMGEDGHTASIFPENKELLTGEKICDVALHPVSGQKRITITGKVINNADEITFLVTGHSKAHVIEQIFKEEASFPASLIVPLHGKIIWFIDEKAGELIQ